MNEWEYAEPIGRVELDKSVVLMDAYEPNLNEDAFLILTKEECVAIICTIGFVVACFIPYVK